MIIVSGKAKTKPGAIGAVRDIMEKTIRATREESGCLDYSYGIDVLDPDTIVVLEYWESADALDAHLKQPHMAEWITALGEAGVISRDIRAFDVTGERKLLG